MAGDPYAAQLSSFTASIPNARRGLIDLYKLRRRGIRSHYNETSRLYGGARTTTGRQYGASRAAIGSFERQGLADVAASGYGMGDADTRAAVRGILTEGTSPFSAFLKTEGAAQGALYRGLKGAEQYEDKTLSTGLRREQPAALSELEQGIIDTSTNLAAQSGAYQQQQQLLAQQQAYMNQMLNYQGQLAGQQAAGPIGAQGANYGYGGGQLSRAEQWIIGKESGSQGVHADNPTSSAFGLGQLLASNRQAYGRQLGFDPNTTDYGQQLAMMRAYIRDRYGTAEQAMRFWQSHGWY
jgi:hypothetical protein